MFLEPLETRALLAVTVLDNGPSENRVDIVFVGDGYTAAEIDTAYPAHIMSMLDHLFRDGEDPYTRYESFFNVHRVNVISNESGADKPEEGIYRDTALDARYYCGGIERLLCISTSKANQKVFEDIGTDFVVDVKMATVNDTKYGGSGGQYAVYAGGNSLATEVALHELAHSFNDLADEYGGSAGPYTGSEPHEVNVTKSSTGDKWAQWLGYSQPVIGLIGAYEGGRYYNTGIYRPSQNSKMRSLNRPFDAVSRETIVLDLYELVDPIDAHSDNSFTITDPGVELWVEVIDQDVIDIEWSVDDVLVAGAAGASFRPADFGYETGAHTVTVRAFDPTDWVRTGRENLEQEVTWDVAFLPLLTLSASVEEISEDGGATTITLTLDEARNVPLTIDLSSDDPGEVSLPDSVELPAHATTISFEVTAVSDGVVDGSQAVTVTASAAGYVPGTQMLSVADIDELRVVELTGTPSGFSARLNGHIDPSVLNLYDVEAGIFGLADVTLAGDSTGRVSGSLVVDVDSVNFIATGGPLPADDYTVTLRSGADAFRSSLTGRRLDGNGDGTPGDDFIGALTLDASSDPVVWLPDFVRGPGQPVDVPPVEVPDGDNTPGLPLRISQAGGVTSLIVTIGYDPALLNIAGAAAGPDAPAVAHVEWEATAPGEVTLTYAGPAAPAGSAELITLMADVPGRAPYGVGQVLDLTVVEVNGGAIPATADDAIHLAAYFGETTGNRRYSGLDAQRAARVAVRLDAGFEAFPLIDPIVVADITSNGAITGLDAQRVSQQAVGFDPTEIPSLPGGGQPKRLDDAVVSLSSSSPESCGKCIELTAPPVESDLEGPVVSGSGDSLHCNDANLGWPGSSAASPRNSITGGSLRSSPATHSVHEFNNRMLAGLSHPQSVVTAFAGTRVSSPSDRTLASAATVVQRPLVIRQDLVSRESVAARPPAGDDACNAVMNDDWLLESLSRASTFFPSVIDESFSSESRW